MPVVDLSFKVRGGTIPLDHGYQLFSAVSRVLPHIHNLPKVGIHPIKGVRIEPRVLNLNDSSKLTLRIDSETIGDYLALAGSEIDLNRHLVSIGVPSIFPLTPSANLAARMVTLKGMTTSDVFLESVKRAMSELHVQGNPEFVNHISDDLTPNPVRRVLRIQGRTIVGFALRITGLSAEESLRLQENGLGGRRHMGCGIFIPY